MKKTFLKVSLMMAVLCIANTAFAEDAPVYDVDNFPPQFDGQSDGTVAPNPKAPSPTPVVSSASTANDDDLQPAMPMPPSTESLSLPQRIARVEQQVNNMQHTDVATKVGDMQTEMQSLRGQVESLTHQIQEMQTQQKKMYADLDKRLGQKVANSSIPSPTAAETPSTDDDSSETPATVPADTIKPKPKAKTSSLINTSSAKSAAAQPNDAEEQKIYQSAYNLIKAKKYNEAATTLQGMLQKYPSGQSAANAHYWLGELDGLMGKNDQAITEFSTVVKNYPDSPKLADAQLKLGLIYAAQLKWPDAKVSFKKVLSSYPGTASARLASEQLKQIKVAGH